MDFRTIVDIKKPDFNIDACENILLVGSCFADNIGKKFEEEKFNVTVNPFGVMYNPASIYHTIMKTDSKPRIAIFTLGTNHVYILKETGEIVENCAKKPQCLFVEKELTIDECAEYITKAINALLKRTNDLKVILTVSPIRYKKYGFHSSALSKATLLLAANKVAEAYNDIVYYFPAYEIINDELRDYRFYSPDMIHPSQQAIEYIWERFSNTLFSESAKKFVEEWKPIKEALGHKPFNPESQEYKSFIDKTMLKVKALSKKYPKFVF
ncbi:MAG: GSCFA domain-containing protein [Prevotella sp.]|nr:GSCFA domain-containing protein [Prevotella sp.]